MRGARPLHSAVTARPSLLEFAREASEMVSDAQLKAYARYRRKALVQISFQLHREKDNDVVKYLKESGLPAVDMLRKAVRADIARMEEKAGNDER